MSTAEEQGWVPATYLESQSGTRDDSDLTTSRTGEGLCINIILFTKQTHLSKGLMCKKHLCKAGCGPSD